MIRLCRLLLPCALAGLLAGCSELPAVFEDVGDDPHPPQLALLGIGVQLPGDPPPPPAYGPPAAGIAVRPYDGQADTLALRFSYADTAADILSVVVRDLDGGIGGSLAFVDFPGTSGFLESTLGVPETSQAGVHRLEVWAEDANQSRSDKISFTVTVELP